ncbi:MAG: carboxypeptidase regulatory-like domain-containing protein, partial [Candidatus Sumerlaeia bacterium]|nr:carboxypeptidase regulatory-like domain-containing protein [Candidatus Sumerlaeia bacterium]
MAETSPTESLAGQSENALSTIAGRVLNASGSPEAGVEVHLLRHTDVLAVAFPQREGLWDLTAAAVTRTGNAGDFEVADLPPGRWWVALTPAPDQMLIPPAPVSVDRGASQTDLLFTLPAVTAVSASAADERGAAVAGAAIHLAVETGRGWWVSRTGTDVQGRFTLPITRGTGESHLFARAAGYAPLSRQRWELSAMQTGAPPSLVFAAGANVEGTVFDPHGQPVANATVWATTMAGGPAEGPFGLPIGGLADGDIPAGAAVTTDAAGVFHLVDLPGGPLDLWATSPGMRLDDSVQTFAVAGDRVAGLVLNLREAHSLSGRVVDASGQAASGAIVRLLPFQIPFLGGDPRWANRSVPFGRPDQWTRTAEDGSFTLGDLRREESRAVVVIADAAPSVQVRGLRASAAAVVTLPAGASLRGEIQSSVTDGPLAGAAVRVTNEETNSRERAVTDARGAFQVHFVEPGAVRLHATAEGHAGRTRRGLEVAANETTEGIALRLVPGVSVSGQVVNRRTQAPVAGAEIRMDAGDESLVAMSAANGSFRFEHVGPAEYDLTTRAPMHMTERGEELAVVTADISNYTIRLEPAARIQGRVTALDGRPIAGATVGTRFE